MEKILFDIKDLDELAIVLYKTEMYELLYPTKKEKIVNNMPSPIKILRFYCTNSGYQDSKTSSPVNTNSGSTGNPD